MTFVEDIINGLDPDSEVYQALKEVPIKPDSALNYKIKFHDGVECFHCAKAMEKAHNDGFITLSALRFLCPQGWLETDTSARLGSAFFVAGGQMRLWNMFSLLAVTHNPTPYKYHDVFTMVEEATRLNGLVHLFNAHRVSFRAYGVEDIFQERLDEISANFLSEAQQAKNQLIEYYVEENKNASSCDSSFFEEISRTLEMISHSLRVRADLINDAPQEAFVEHLAAARALIPEESFEVDRWFLCRLPESNPGRMLFALKPGSDYALVPAAYVRFLNESIYSVEDTVEDLEFIKNTFDNSRLEVDEGFSLTDAELEMLERLHSTDRDSPYFSLSATLEAVKTL